MAIKKTNIGSYIVIYEDETNALLSFEPTDDYKAIKEKVTTEILAKKEEFKQRGVSVVKQQFVANWGTLIDNSLAELDKIWYNGASIEATLQCMEKLSQGFPVEEAYIPIDIQNPDAPCVYFGMELSGWQNYSVASVIGTYHERGQEFCDYRNNYVNNYTSGKHRQLLKKKISSTND